MADLPTKDIRTPANEQRRYKNASAKWKYSNSWPTVASPGEDEAPKRSRPLKAPVRQSHPHPNHNKGVIKTSSSHPWISHQGRLYNTVFAKLEARDSDTEIDLSPRGSETLGNLDEIYYSFDADASPASSLGLDNLVEQAVTVAKAKEVERLVKDEYEVLDSEGEKIKVSKKHKKKGGKPALNMNTDDYFEDVDGDWETI